MPFSIFKFIKNGVEHMKTVSDIFGTLVFDDRVMKARLPHDVYLSLKKTIDAGGRLDSQVADASLRRTTAR